MSIAYLTICCVSDREKLARERVLKSQKLQLGMTDNEVKEIIGQPDTIIFYDRVGCCPAYLYDLNDDSYGAAVVRFDSLDRVESIRFPKQD